MSIVLLTVAALTVGLVYAASRSNYVTGAYLIVVLFTPATHKAAAVAAVLALGAIFSVLTIVVRHRRRVAA